MSAEHLSTAQVQMRSIYSALKVAGGRGMVRKELVMATGLTLHQVREATAAMWQNHWIYEARQVVKGRVTYRYATCWQHWHRI